MFYGPYRVYLLLRIRFLIPIRDNDFLNVTGAGKLIFSRAVQSFAASFIFIDKWQSFYAPTSLIYNLEFVLFRILNYELQFITPLYITIYNHFNTARFSRFDACSFRNSVSSKVYFSFPTTCTASTAFCVRITPILSFLQANPAFSPYT